MVSCALSNSIFSCVASWVLNSNLINKKTEIKEKDYWVLNSNLINKNTEIKEKDNWVAINKNIHVSTTRFSEARREGSICLEMYGLEIRLLVRNG